LFELDDNHLKSNDLPIFYRDFLFFARLSFLLRAKNVIADFPGSFLLRLLHYVSSIQYGDDRISRKISALTTMEAAAVRRIKLEGHIADMRIRRDKIERMIRVIDRAFESLDDADAELLRERYMQGRSWAQVAEL